ncbi:MAG: hypothetical protein LBR22_00155 [Desulfovibrio sp.]|jgi:hypothetical protein|nr:hypothetical protein [Desulfovibrio sp.]
MMWKRSNLVSGRWTAPSPLSLGIAALIARSAAEVSAVLGVPLHTEISH